MMVLLPKERDFNWKCSGFPAYRRALIDVVPSCTWIPQLSNSLSLSKKLLTFVLNGQWDSLLLLFYLLQFRVLTLIVAFWIPAFQILQIPSDMNSTNSSNHTGPYYWGLKRVEDLNKQMFSLFSFWYSWSFKESRSSFSTSSLFFSFRPMLLTLLRNKNQLFRKKIGF